MKVHFIAIGGSVMHQLAIALKNIGYEVSGSDDEIFEPARSVLRNGGILPALEGWFPEKVHEDLDAIILGMHARADNPELEKARSLGLKIYSFPEYLYHESRNKTRVIVGGSHGKTTTTAMLMHVLQKNGKDFDYLVGAGLQGFSQSVKLSSAPVLVCEGDEYPASVIERRPKFHFLFPHIAIITGISWDHINIFPTVENYIEQFKIFIEKIETGGTLIFNQEDRQLLQLVDAHRRQDIQYIPYGVPEHRIEEGRTLVQIGEERVKLSIFGAHNLMNMQAAYLAGRELGLSAPDFARAIADFQGASRRLEKIGANDQTIIFRDFAHAPSKLAATIQAVREQFSDRKLIAVFELHTFSSLSRAFLNQYAGSLDPADEALVYYSDHALELKRLPALQEADVKAGFANEALEICSKPDSLLHWLNERDYQNSVLLLMSSGDFDGLDMLTFAGKISRPS